MRVGRTTRRGRERGQSTLETAVMIVVIFGIVFWVFEIGWLMYTYSVMADAANEGVRYAIVHSGGDATGTSNRVKTFAATSLHNVSAISVAVSDPDGSYTPPNRVRVQVTYTYVPWLSNFMSSPPSMSTYSEGRMVVQ